MRIVQRQELMSLPQGTLYSNVYMTPGQAGFTHRGLEVFGGALHDGERNYDFATRSIDIISAPDSHALIDREAELLTGARYPVNPNYGRDGMFDDEDRYLVFEQGDIESILSDVLKAYPGAAEAALTRPFAWAQSQDDDN